MTLWIFTECECLVPRFGSTAKEEGGADLVVQIKRKGMQEDSQARRSPWGILYTQPDPQHKVSDEESPQ